MDTIKNGIINDNGIVQTIYPVTYDYLNSNLQLKPVSAVTMCQNLAVLHSTLAGYPVEYFKKNHCGWVLSGWYFEFHEPITENENVTLQTFVNLHKRIQCNRSFVAYNDAGTILWKASSLWILMDTLKRAPQRLNEEFINNYKLFDGDPAIKLSRFRFTSTEDFSELSTNSFSVLKHDIDTNGHTNNVSYITWSIDSLASEDLHYDSLDSLKVIYAHETRLGDNITVVNFIKQTEKNLQTISNIYKDDDSENIVAQVIITVSK